MTRNERVKAEKAERDKKIFKYYDGEKSDKENLQGLKEKGINISIAIFKRRKKENGLTKPKR